MDGNDDNRDVSPPFSSSIGGTTSPKEEKTEKQKQLHHQKPQQLQQQKQQQQQKQHPQQSQVRPKKTRKKRRAPDVPSDPVGESGKDGGGSVTGGLPSIKASKEGKIKKKRSAKEAKEAKEKRKEKRAAQKSAQQLAAQEQQMRRALEDDRYSAVGSIVSGTDTEEEDDLLQPSDIRAAMRKRLWTIERRRVAGGVASEKRGKTGKSDSEVDSEGTSASSSARRGRKKKKKSKPPKGGNDDKSSVRDRLESELQEGGKTTRSSERLVGQQAAATATSTSGDDEESHYEEGSIFGPTTGSTQTTWVECDKCKKWRRLRGVVDESKLPSKWYCYMNKNDPERSKCSAPEEEYSETPKPEENAAEARTRKHLRVWVKRLRTQEAFREARRPITRGTKRTHTANSKDPYEWVQCCACGKWRAGLRFMDKSQFLLERTSKWYCVMNTWDEKMASCAAPQENLPAIGCPPWVMQDET